jgi:ubiquinone/menaquinone biosynthesis C-methylase UbiE
VREADFERKKDLIRKRLLKYTRRAFRMLPPLDKPRILDVGCGSGFPTMELARLTNGEVIGMDIDRELLNKFRQQVVEAGVSDRVKVLECSITEMQFPDASFDIIWAEGSIYVIGFRRALQEWKHFLAPDGFMGLHDERGNVGEKLAQIADCGYELIGHFILDQDVWWKEYFSPLEKLINEAQARYADNPGVRESLSKAREELDMFRNYPQRNCSAFFIMKRSY